MDLFKLKNSDQIYFDLDSWCSAGGILEPGTVFFILKSYYKDLIESGSDPDPKHCIEE